VWAPRAGAVDVVVESGPRAPLAPGDRGWWEGTVAGVRAGARYRYSLDGGEPLPDPASRAQPDGVHGPSAVVSLPRRGAARGWRGVPRDRLVLYEIHVGTFTREGTFDAAVGELDRLADLGVTAIEPMPVAQFPGGRNWGYDGVFPYAAQSTYGGAAGLTRLVDAAHARGIAVVLDVVYNHLGPEGNVLGRFGPYFTSTYRTPWGDAINFDGPDSDEVRRFFLGNALWWIEDVGVDGLRLDAVHAIRDHSAYPFLEELADVVRERATRLGREVHLIAESDLNDCRLVRSPREGGYGLDAHWCDDFHHAVHAALTGERDGYYEDFGSLEQVATALRDAILYAGTWSAHRRRRHGRPCTDVPADRFVVCVQNHDQVGNRMRGERLSSLVDFDARKLAAGLLLLSPFVPLLFMGEEYGETAPFPYFTSHGDADLVEAVRRGRAEEFAAFAWGGTPPDPQDPATFASARIDAARRTRDGHRAIHDLHRRLLALRRDHPALRDASRARTETGVLAEDRVVWMHRWSAQRAVFACFGLADEAVPSPPLPGGDDAWSPLLDSAWDVFGGPLPGGGRDAAPTLAPHSFRLYEKRGT
jgi:maltooligosyltrehalose trehalohydrolase